MSAPPSWDSLSHIIRLFRGFVKRFLKKTDSFFVFCGGRGGKSFKKWVTEYKGHGTLEYGFID